MDTRDKYIDGVIAIFDLFPDATLTLQRVAQPAQNEVLFINHLICTRTDLMHPSPADAPMRKALFGKDDSVDPHFLETQLSGEQLTPQEMSNIREMDGLTAIGAALPRMEALKTTHWIFSEGPLPRIVEARHGTKILSVSLQQAK